jgi:membrane associated rhomboid family serine protease
MLRMTDVVKNLLILNVIIFFAVRYLIPVPNFENYFIFTTPGLDYINPYTGIHHFFEPVQIITNLFMHADERHLLFNMFGLYMFGPYVESSLKPKRFLTLYLISGVVATIAQVLVTHGSVVGASGAIYGVVIAFATMFPNLELMLLFPPIPIKAKYMGVGMVAIGLFSGVTGAQAGIGHFAHIAGAICGFLLVHFWKMANLR